MVCHYHCICLCIQRVAKTRPASGWPRSSQGHAPSRASARAASSFPTREGGFTKPPPAPQLVAPPNRRQAPRPRPFCPGSPTWTPNRTFRGVRVAAHGFCSAQVLDEGTPRRASTGFVFKAERPRGRGDVRRVARSNSCSCRPSGLRSRCGRAERPREHGYTRAH